MTSVLRRVYGNQALYLASQAYARLHIYSTYAALTADVSTAVGRIAYCVATDTVYVGQGGTWVPVLSGGELAFQGAWNANTNSPTVTSGVGTLGQYYKVSTAGTTTIDGNSNWNIGDILLYNGTTWDQILGPNSGNNAPVSIGQITSSLTVSANTIFSVPIAVVTSLTLEITLKKGGNTFYQTTYVVNINDSTTPAGTEFNINLGPPSGGTFDCPLSCNISGGNLNIICTPLTTGWTAEVRARTFS
jgi:hypothetical protein